MISSRWIVEPLVVGLMLLVVAAINLDGVALMIGVLCIFAASLRNLP